MKYTNETFIKKATEKYDNKYTYDKVNYINSQTKVEIIGNENFSETEEEVKVRVTSTSGKIKEYKIKLKQVNECKKRKKE